MRIRSPSLSELHAFVRAAQTGSFTKAATQLSVTQAAVSRAVMRLEQNVGCTLLQRHVDGLALTARGQAYFNEIGAALAQLEDAAQHVRAKATQRQALRICVIPSLSTRWLVPRLSAFQALHPDIELVFKTYLVDDDFLRPDVDCWIQTKHTATHRWPRHVKASYLVGKEIVVVCNPTVANHIRDVRSLLKYPLLHHANYPGNWRTWLDAAGCPDVALQLGPGFDMVAGIIEGVVSGLGVAVVQRCLVERELQERRLVVPLPITASTGRGYHLCMPKAGRNASAAQAFEAWLLKAAAQAGPDQARPPAASAMPPKTKTG